jgi:hypothetical protein
VTTDEKLLEILGKLDEVLICLKAKPKKKKKKKKSAGGPHGMA